MNMDKLEKYLARQEFEHNLINRRLTWLLTSQSILFAALAFSLGQDVNPDHKTLFLIIVSSLGLFLSMAIFLGIWMGVRAKYLNYKDINKDKDKDKDIDKDDEIKKKGEKIPWGVRTWITNIALIPDVLMPVAFSVAWLFILLKMGLQGSS